MHVFLAYYTRRVSASRTSLVKIVSKLASPCLTTAVNGMSSSLSSRFHFLSPRQNVGSGSSLSCGILRGIKGVRRGDCGCQSEVFQVFWFKGGISFRRHVRCSSDNQDQKDHNHPNDQFVSFRHRRKEVIHLSRVDGQSEV
jgi:hypothetical protein